MPLLEIWLFYCLGCWAWEPLLLHRFVEYFDVGLIYFHIAKKVSDGYVAPVAHVVELLVKAE